MLHWGKLWDAFVLGDPDSVAALATFAAFVVAFAAAAFVLWQIRDARSIRRAQAEPDVVAYMESNPNQPQMVEFAIKNFGVTPARNITVRSQPPLRRTTGGVPGVEPVWLPPTIPYLAPGQEWRTTWDVAPSRVASSTLKGEDRHEIVVEFDRRKGRRRNKTVAVLDWSAYKGRRFLAQKSVHHVAGSVASIDKSLKSVIRSKTLRVVTRDGEQVARAELAYWAKVDLRSLIDQKGRVLGRLIWLWRRLRRRP